MDNELHLHWNVHLHQMSLTLSGLNLMSLSTTTYLDYSCEALEYLSSTVKLNILDFIVKVKKMTSERIENQVCKTF